MTAKSRSRWPCQSMPTPPPHSSTTWRRTARPPRRRAGVAWPTVSAMQTRDGAGANRRRVERAQRVGIGARRVLGHVHDRQPLADRERDRLLGQLQQLIERPALGVLPQRARPDERAALDRHAGPLRDLGDRLDVGDERPRGAVGRDRQPLVGDLARQPLDVAHDVRSGARQADVGRVDARADRSGAGCGASRRSSGSAPTATAARRAASRRRAGPSAAVGAPARFQS